MTRVLPVILLCWLGFSGSFRPSGASTDPDTSAADPARAVLAKGEYPWYDSANDRVRPVDLTPKRESSWLRSLGDWVERGVRAIGDVFARIARMLHLPKIGSIGNTLPIVLTVLGVVLFIILIRVLWGSARFDRSDDVASDRTVGGTGRITALPSGMGASAVADPWAEAVERRRQGDYAGAVVYLFAYQLLELDRLGLIRLTPGGTGRKYVRSLDDSRLRDLLSATLGLFEQAYYGHKRPSATSFESVWAEVRLFRSHLASIEKRSS